MDSHDASSQRFMAVEQQSIPAAQRAGPDGNRHSRIVRRAMVISLVVGVFMFFGKGLAYWLTGSVAILSDAAESVVHLAAVGFAAYSVWVSERPADRTHLYGHEKVGYFSAGFEGALIAIAGLYIISSAVHKWIVGLALENLSAGAAIVAAAAALNGLLGAYLVRTGRRYDSLIVRANGIHVLTDCWTSVGVIAALVAVHFSGFLWLDPAIAILVASNIVWSGGKLVRQSVRGLMDEVDPEVDEAVRRVLDRWSEGEECQYHGLRHRRALNTTWIEVHLLLPDNWSLTRAHASATALESQISTALPGRVVLTTHLEPREQHEEHHPEGGDDHEDR